MSDDTRHTTGRPTEEHDPAFLLELYDRMVTIREFEDGVKYLFLEGTMPGTIHQCQGQEASAVGVCAALETDDIITSTHRPHGHALAKGLTMEEMLLELFGASSGCCGGRGGSMHMGNIDKGMIPAIAVVGAAIPPAAGAALAFKMQKSRRIVACFFGDGAVAEGAFHEGVNLAAIWQLPVIFVCENNQYGASTNVHDVMRTATIAERAASYGIRGEQVDGNSVLDVVEATRRAASECREGKGPVLLELLTYRFAGHSRRDARHYQPPEEQQEWMAKDPIRLMAGLLTERGIADDAELEQRRQAIVDEFNRAAEVAREARKPDPARDLLSHVFSEKEDSR